MKRKKGISIKESVRRKKQSEQGLVSYKGGFKFTKQKNGSYLLEEVHSYE